MGSGQVSVISGNSRPRGALVIFGLILFVFAGLFALLWYGLAIRGAPPLATGSAPSFELVTFDGQHISSASLGGKAVIVNFWASWCVPCRDEAPVLQRAWEKYRDRGLVVVGVDYVDTEPEARKFISDFSQTYPNGADLGTRVSQAYHISGVPETYFITREGKMLPGIDAQGHVNANWIGPVPEDALNTRISLLLSQ